MVEFKKCDNRINNLFIPQHTFLRSKFVIASLDCGHEIYLDVIDNKVYNGRTFNKQPAGLGREINCGDCVNCHHCSEEQFRREVLSLPIVKAEIYPDKDSLFKAHPKLSWESYGPIHKHGNKYYVQVYLGGHNWLSFNVENLLDYFIDPGWSGKEFGYGFILEEYVSYSQYVPSIIVSEPIPPEQVILNDNLLEE